MTGLVLIAPFGPSPSQLVSQLTEAAQCLNSRRLLPDIADANEVLEQMGEPNPAALFTDMARQELTVEPDMYDMLLVTSAADPVVGSDDVEEVQEWYGNMCDEIEFEGSGESHLYFLDPEWDAEGGTSDQIVEWIDENYM